MAVPSFGSVTAFSVLAALLSGCLADPTGPAGLQVTADGAVRFAAWDYQAVTRQPLPARLAATLDPVQDLVELSVNGTWTPPTGATVEAPFAVAFTPRAEEPVRADIIESLWPGHLPTVPVRMVADGTARVTIGNRTLVDNYNQEDNWTARFVVLDRGIRDVVRGHVLKADRSGPFDPQTPEDVFLGSDTEAMLLLTSRRPQDALPLPLDVRANVADRGATDTPFEVEVTGSSIHVTVTFAQGATAVGPYAVKVIDPDGNEVAQQAKGVVQRSSVAAFDLVAHTPGTWNIRVQTATAGTDYTVSGEIVPPPRPAWWLHWETFTLGSSGSPSAG